MKRTMLLLTVVLLLLGIVGQASADMIRLAPAQDQSQRYLKEFYVNQVNAGATINAGAVIQSWFNPDDTKTMFDTLFIKGAKDLRADQNVATSYIHAPNLSLRDRINGNNVFPVQPTGANVDQVLKNNPGVAYFPDPVSITDNNHGKTNPNMADATIKVETRVVGKLPNKIKVNLSTGGTELTELTNSVHTVLGGSATAGAIVKPADTDKIHSADSFAAVEIKGDKTFVRSPATKSEFTESTGRAVMIGGAFDTPEQRDRGSELDPYFVSLTNLDTQTMTREITATLNLDWSGAFYSVDDSGIRLTVNRNDPLSMVSLAFHSDLSSWVLNPYSYGATLTPTGFTAFGITPQSDWTVTMTSDTIMAFFPFGSGGQPFDVVMARAPDSLFVDGDNYRYDSGSSVGTFQVTTSVVPEPPTFLLFSLGVSLIVYRWGQRTFK